MFAMKLIDTHAHLEQIVDVEQSLEKAKAVGVAAIIAVGMSLDSNKRILELAEKNPEFVYPAFGIHPWAIEASELGATIEFISTNIGKCVAIGEIGLDYKIKQDKKLQKKVFGVLLDIAVANDLPVLTHSRYSYERVFQMVKDSGAKKAVFHWYSGPMEIVEKIIGSGYFISATPAVEYSEVHREVISAVPLDNLLLETDCPVDYKGVVSTPAMVEFTLQEVAKLKGEAPEVVAQTTTKNAEKLFRLDF